jgi:hypothetical protein
MYLHNFHDFEHVVTFNLTDELKKGQRVLDIPALFPSNAAAERFASRPRPRQRPGVAVLVVLVAVPCVLVGIALVASVEGSGSASGSQRSLELLQWLYC